MSDIARAINTVLVDCLGVKPIETVLVVTDPAKRAIGEAIVNRARELAAEAVLLDMAERRSHGSEPPRVVAVAMLECDVVIAPTSKSLSHSDARNKASGRGIRIATMPDVTEDILVRTMSVDYREVKRRSELVADALTNAGEVRVTTSAGTDVTMSIKDRQGIPDTGDLTAPGAFGNLPAGEGFIAPVEGSANGRIVFDGSIWPVGALTEPLVVDIRDGYATQFEGPSAARFTAALDPHGKEAFAVAEFGIGTNDAAILGGNVLEDEKILGTVHVAFGDNHSFGGAIRVESHQDGVILSPEVTIDDRVLLAGGRLRL